MKTQDRLVLLNDGRQVSPDRALSRITYQLARIENGKILREVDIQRGEDCIRVDLTNEDAYEAITKTWGIADWRIVDNTGTPFADRNLRDGTTYIAIKAGEVIGNKSAMRSFSKFTVNKYSDEIRFMIICGHQTQYVWMQPFSPCKVREVCKSTWGPGNYTWDGKELEGLHGRTLHVQKKQGRFSSEKMVNFKVTYVDEPGKPIEMKVQYPCGKLTYELEKTLRCRLWGRDFYLETSDKNPHLMETFDGDERCIHSRHSKA